MSTRSGETGGHGNLVRWQQVGEEAAAETNGNSHHLHTYDLRTATIQCQMWDDIQATFNWKRLIQNFFSSN